MSGILKSGWAMVLAVALLLSACATTQQKVSTSPAIPAAEGNVKVKDAGPNTAIELRVKNLAPPYKIDPQATVYDVWVQPRTAGAAPQSIGAIVPDRDLNAKLKSTTTLKDFDLFVTAEPSALVSQPSGQRLLWTSVSR